MNPASWLAPIAACALVHPCVVSAAAAPGPFALPHKPDPPPAIDGQLDDWAGVPNAVHLATRAHCVHGQQNWTSPADLSAQVRLAWRDDCLYLAADVTDDRLRQTLQDRAMWRGDHVELYIDLAPEAPPGRAFMGAGQVQFGFSPGNFKRSGDSRLDIPAGTIVFHPEGASAAGILVATQKTDTGYTLEAAIPWELLRQLVSRPDLRPARGMSLGIELAVSDTDADAPVQESMIALRPEPWRRACERLAAAVLAGADGVAPDVVSARDLLPAAELPPGAKRELAFVPPAVPPGKELVLELKARLHSPRPAGYTRGMRLSLNGQRVDGARLVNWERQEQRVNGVMMSPAAGDIFNVPYSPDYDAPNRHPTYALRTGPKLCRYEVRVTDLVRPGENVLLIENRAGLELAKTLVLGDVRVVVRPPVVVRARRPAPKGPLPLIRPMPPGPVDFSVETKPEATLDVAIAGVVFRVESEFSTPAPAWVRGSNPHFEHRRDVARRDECVLVRDTFTNRTGANLPLAHRHCVTSPRTWRKVWLAGLSPSALASTSAEPANPTAYGALETVGIGVFPLDDVSLVHVANFTTDTQVGFADNFLVLKPGTSHTVEWAVLPTGRADYYAFLNAARRLRGVNFTLEGSFAFLRADPRLGATTWSDSQCADFIRFKNAHFLSNGLSWPRLKGRYAHGTAFQQMDWSLTTKQVARLRALVPETRHLKYYHCFIDVLDSSPEKYADARLLRADGSHADYGKPHDRLYVPTAVNGFGRDVARNVDIILGTPAAGLGCDGVYWDEVEYSRYQYAHRVAEHGAPGALPWDGVSADIDPKTLKIVRLKSSVELISQPFRLALARRILARGPLVANGQPRTRTMLELHFPRFVETGSISRCALAQMYSPIALGDHLTERSELDAYRVMLRALDFGCLYYWYGDLTVVPTHPHITSYMFPSTPIELGAGYLIARERIVTNRSGMFGWSDNRAHKVRVFDEQGRERPGFDAPAVRRDGMTFTELRLPEDYSAVIVPQPSTRAGER